MAFAYCPDCLVRLEIKRKPKIGQVVTCWCCSATMRICDLNPLQLDSPPPKIPVEKYFHMENRFKMLTKTRPDAVKGLFGEAQKDIRIRRGLYEYLAARRMETDQK